MILMKFLHHFTSDASGLGPWDLQETTLPGFFFERRNAEHHERVSNIQIIFEI
jgi:hypothetical protein